MKLDLDDLNILRRYALVAGRAWRINLIRMCLLGADLAVGEEMKSQLREAMSKINPLDIYLLRFKCLEKPLCGY